MPPKENDFLASPSVRKKWPLPWRGHFFANSTPQKVPLWASVQGLRQKLPQVLGTTGFAAPEQYGIGQSDRRGSRSSRPEAAPPENGRCHRGIHPGDPRQLGRQSPLVFARTRPKKIQNSFTKHLYSQLIRAIISLPSQDRAPVLPKNA